MCFLANLLLDQAKAHSEHWVRQLSHQHHQPQQAEWFAVCRAEGGRRGVAFPVKIIIVSPRPQKNWKNPQTKPKSSPNWANKLMNPSREWILELATTRRSGAGRGRQVWGCGCDWDEVLVVQLVWAWARAQNRTEANRTESVAWILWKWSKFHFIATTKAKANKKLSSTAFRVWSAGCAIPSLVFSAAPRSIFFSLVFSGAPLPSLLLPVLHCFFLLLLGLPCFILVFSSSPCPLLLLSSALCFSLLLCLPFSSLFLIIASALPTVVWCSSCCFGPVL